MEKIDENWEQLITKLQNDFGEEIDIKGVLFLIGIQELQIGIRNFSKEEKQDILHVAVCRLLSVYGYYEFEKFDQDGWPHYKELKILKNLSEKDQDNLIKKAVLDYFG